MLGQRSSDQQTVITNRHEKSSLRMLRDVTTEDEGNKKEKNKVEIPGYVKRDAERIERESLLESFPNLFLLGELLLSDVRTSQFHV